MQSEITPEDTGIVTLILLSRLYDVGMALLTEKNPEVADRLAEIHEAGRFLGPPPAITSES